MITVWLLISAIFFTLLESKTSHGFPGFDIQHKTTMLSIQTVVVEMRHRRNVLDRFFTMSAAMWPLSNSSLGMEVFLFDFRAFDGERPLLTPDERSMTAMVAAQNATLISSANTW